MMKRPLAPAVDGDVVLSRGRFAVTGKSVLVGNDAGAYRPTYFSGKRVIGLFDDRDDFSEIGRAF